MLRAVLFVLVALVSSSASVFAQCTAPPAPPTNMSVTRDGSDLFVQWTDGSGATACRATRFYVEISHKGLDVREFTVDPGAGSDPTAPFGGTIPSVPFGGFYRIAVRSFNSRGVSPQSSVYLNEELPRCSGFAPPVTQGVASAVGRTVTLTWAYPGHCSVIGFRIAAAASPDGPELYAQMITNPAARSFTAIAPPGVWYIRVYAAIDGGLFTAPSPWATVSVQ